MHWEGSTLVGKLELNISEGFRKSGICSTYGDQAAMLLLNGYKIGISSRAIGSVESKLGVLVVGNDLELVGWDLVATPSTPGAYLSVHGKEELQQYVESDTSKEKKSKLNEKLDKIEKLMFG